MILIGCQSASAETVSVSGSRVDQPLGQYIEYLSDPYGKIDLESILSLQNASRLTRSKKSTLNFGVTDSTYWLVFDVENKDKKNRSLFIEIDSPLTDNIEIFYIIENRLESKNVFGDRQVFGERLVNHRKFLMPLELSSKQSVKIVIKAKTTGLLSLNLHLYSPVVFVGSDAKENTIQGLYFGSLLVMIIYNSFIYLTTRSRAYLYYVIYTISYMIIHLHFAGLDYQYIWPNSPIFQNHILFISFGVMGWGLINFYRYFLNLRLTYHRLDGWLKIFGFSSVFFAVCSPFVPVAYGWLATLLFYILCFAILLCVNIFRVRQRSVEGRYFLLAMAAYICGVVVYMLSQNGMIASFFLTDYAVEIGSSIEFLIFSLGLADRLKRLQQEDIDSKKEAAENLQMKAVGKTQEFLSAKAESVQAQKNAENLREKAEIQAEKLEELDKQKTSFFQNISHELRTPLTLILNPLENLLREMPNNKHAEIATKNSRRLLRLVNQLLDFQKLEAGKKDLTLSPINVSYFLNVCGDYFCSACTDMNISFSMTYDGKNLNSDSEPVWVMGEIDALEKVVFNYLSNALKYTKRNGTIELGLRIIGDRVRLFVSDTGIGVSQDDQTKLFQLFIQVGEQASRAHEGTGLGLALVKDLSDQMDAEVGIDSQLGEGSTFWIEFDSINIDKPIVKVLIVEDDNILRYNLVDSLLENLDLDDEDVAAKSSVREAIEFLEQHEVCCIISDYNLPAENGLELMKDISKRYPKAYRIIITGEPNVELLEGVVNEKLVHQVLYKSTIPQDFNLKLQEAVSEHLKKNIGALNIYQPAIDVLIVDDDKGLRETLQRAFSWSQFTTKIVDSTDQALQALEEHPVRILLSDYRMSKRDGLSLLNEVAKRFPDTLRFLMTGEVNFEVLDSAMNEDSVTRIFLKPIDIGKVLETFESLLDRNNINNNLQMNQSFKVKPWLLAMNDDEKTEEKCETKFISSGAEGLSILVIDDLADMRDLIAETLNKASYNVITASSSKSGFEEAKNHTPDLIITDWMMSGLSGPNLIKNLRSDDELRSIPVVLLTAKSDEESRLIGTEVGADAFLGKPFNDQELLSTVKNLIQLTETSKRELRHAKNLLTQSEKLSQLGSMVASIGHEIANPISLISLGCSNEHLILGAIENHINKIIESKDQSVQTLGKDILKQIDQLRTANESVNLGSERLQDLSLALRTQSRTEQRATINVEVNDVIRESMLISSGRMKDFLIQESLGKIKKVTCHRSKIGQVITNLINNAVDSLAEKNERLSIGTAEKFVGKVVIGSENKDRNGVPGIVFSVADNGDGVPDSIRDKIFEQFFTTKPAGYGTGLGLSLSFEIIKDHGGTLEVTKDPVLGGARFDCWLPLSLDDMTSRGSGAA